ncbi:polyprenyl glycosylphosphotransferase [Gordonia spumicola]|uniref:Polyprenyl glycosylphosphotransferase n=1 Tax=Gordonia spumicola TaxID=589161 RepID=A0A7I9V4N1_9ACTN|nr:polyprenyl glycosylphosphotransferase [Gordonia spumicola]
MSSPVVGGFTESSTPWQRRHQARVRWGDWTVVVVSIALTQLIAPFPPVVGGRLSALVGALAFIAIAWKLALRATRSDHLEILGSGRREYVRVTGALASVLAVVGMCDMLFEISHMKYFWMVLAGVGLVLTLGARWAANLVDEIGRRSGRRATSILVAGEASSVVTLIEFVNDNPGLGYRVVGACLPGTTLEHGPLIVGDHEIPVCGDLRSGTSAVETMQPDAVVLTSVDMYDHAAMRELSWRFASMNILVMIAAGQLADFGTRVSMREHAGLPMLHLDHPRYGRARSSAKRVFDVVLSILIVALISPVLIGCALAVKLGDGGPVFYRAERVGLDNRRFKMWKFRSMIVDADRMRDALADQQTGNGVLFKIEDDPRVTRVGRLMRRFSLDELPQLFNVVGGSMSLVGPRPPLPAEVAEYDDLVTKRMLVLPGMTGLWQVSGRSDLSWSRSVHLDLTYVENWSLAGDLGILFRTVRAVARADGAY